MEPVETKAFKGCNEGLKDSTKGTRPNVQELNKYWKKKMQPISTNFSKRMTTLTQIQDEHNGNMVIKTQFPTTTQITGTPQKTNLLNRGSKYQEVFFVSFAVCFVRKLIKN